MIQAYSKFKYCWFENASHDDETVSKLTALHLYVYKQLKAWTNIICSLVMPGVQFYFSQGKVKLFLCFFFFF
ncbi:hypothetical protein RchiOBHm_Chr6g0309601 [Rosa chinensis]|uniref:Uncharacterized protein n=1 Tax=Rosa chinensis TaxID=74649 RepID=A0A2P6Q0X4_ROSCH|nr:hypothetical protein RchiOBHm_Chr6g0309601 [Rosa chinensis]